MAPELVAPYPALDEALAPAVCEDAVTEADMFDDARLEGEAPYPVPNQWTLPSGLMETWRREEVISPSQVDVDDAEDEVLSVCGWD